MDARFTNGTWITQTLFAPLNVPNARVRFFEESGTYAAVDLAGAPLVVRGKAVPARDTLGAALDDVTAWNQQSQ